MCSFLTVPLTFVLVAQVAHARAELCLVEAVLSRTPKALAAWAHRRWVLARSGLLPPQSRGKGGAGPRLGLGFVGGIDEVAVDVVVAGEMRVCARAAELKRLNYSAWRHRR